MSHRALAPTAVVLDVGNVLIEWDPRHLYRRLLPDEEAVEHFLTTVCTAEWNLRQDAGRPWAEAVATLSAEHPEHAALIEAYDARWDEMCVGPLDDAVSVLADLRARGVPVYAVTNFSVDKFAVARRRFGFLDWFDDRVVSGEEGVVKPDPEIFRRALDRFGLDAGRAVFADDSTANVAAASALGMHAVHVTGPGVLRAALVRLDLLDG